MSGYQAFAPAYGTSQSITLTTASQRVPVPANAKSLQVLNLTSSVIFVRCGDATVTASSTTPTADFPIPPSSLFTLTKGDDTSHVAIIGAGAGGNVWVTAGEGF